MLLFFVAITLSMIRLWLSQVALRTIYRGWTGQVIRKAGPLAGQS
jgi:hypothetical protein